MKYIDVHGHINFSDYDNDREIVIKRAQDALVGIVVVGTDLESSKQSVALAEVNENMWAIIGQHPTDVGAVKFDYQAFKALALNKKVVAIGECGLDYFHSKPEEIANQREVFIEHIKLANEVKKPLMLHVRNGKNTTDSQSAYQEAVNLLKQHAKVPINFHFFAGSLEDAKAILDIGGLMSFTGVITFTHDYDEVIKFIPLENIMSETDCPYVAPVPNRGKRNEPVYVIEVVKAIARIKGLGEDVVAAQLLKNTQNFINI